MTHTNKVLSEYVKDKIQYPLYGLKKLLESLSCQGKTATSVWSELTPAEKIENFVFISSRQQTSQNDNDAPREISHTEMNMPEEDSSIEDEDFLIIPPVKKVAQKSLKSTNTFI
jgi:hypothetical protein